MQRATPMKSRGISWEFGVAPRDLVRSPASPCMFNSVSSGGKIPRRRGAWRWELTSVVARIGVAPPLRLILAMSPCIRDIALPDTDIREAQSFPRKSVLAQSPSFFVACTQATSSRSQMPCRSRACSDTSRRLRVSCARHFTLSTIRTRRSTSPACTTVSRQHPKCKTRRVNGWSGLCSGREYHARLYSFRRARRVALRL